MYVYLVWLRMGGCLGCTSVYIPRAMLVVTGQYSYFHLLILSLQDSSPEHSSQPAQGASKLKNQGSHRQISSSSRIRQQGHPPPKRGLGQEQIHMSQISKTSDALPVQKSESGVLQPSIQKIASAAPTTFTSLSPQKAKSRRSGASASVPPSSSYTCIDTLEGLTNQAVIFRQQTDPPFA